MPDLLMRAGMELRRIRYWRPLERMASQPDATQQQVEEIVLANEVVKKWMDGKSPKKVIYVKNKMVNVVV